MRNHRGRKRIGPNIDLAAVEKTKASCEHEAFP